MEISKSLLSQGLLKCSPTSNILQYCLYIDQIKNEGAVISFWENSDLNFSSIYMERRRMHNNAG